MNGSYIVSNSSFLKKKFNTQVFNNRIIIIDDSLLQKDIKSRSFDEERIIK
ncbi:MAG: metallopeptidase TldD-related protein [Wolbachia sp.]